MVIRSEGRSARLWVNGPDTVAKSEPLLGSVTIIGRGEHCDIRLDDPTVSTDHAEISRHGSSYLLHDLGSRNGTVVNAKVIAGPTRLQHADVLQIGPFRLEATLPTSHATERDETLSVELDPEQLAVACALVANYRLDKSFAGRPATRREIAEQLHLSDSTVKRHLENLAAKLRVPSTAGRERPRLIADRVIALGLDRR